jgi:hypothetical protein
MNSLSCAITFNAQRSTEHDQISALSAVLTSFSCVLILFCYFKGNYSLSREVNSSLISKTEKWSSVMLVILIILMEILYINGSNVTVIPVVSVYCWILTNGIVVFTLVYSQALKEHFRLLIYIPFIIYECSTLFIIVQRILVSSEENYDVLILLVFMIYTIFCSYTVPKCFITTNRHLIFYESIHKEKHSDVPYLRNNGLGMFEEIQMQNK